MAPTASLTEVLDTTSLEKQNDTHVEEALTRKSKEIPNDDEFDAEFTPEEWRKIKRRIDRRLIVTCGFMYTISVMDRNNVGAAAIAGLTTELELNIGYRYVSLFYRRESEHGLHLSSQ
jgi:hypothetical protein